MARLWIVVAAFVSLSFIAFAGQEPSLQVLALAKRFAATPTLSEFSYKPLVAADEEVRKEFFKSLDGTKISGPNRILLCVYFAKKDPSEDIRAAAVAGLAKAKDSKLALKTLADALADKSPAIRKSACESLTGVRGDPTLGPKFSKLLYDPSIDVRQAAARALGKLNDRTQTAALITAYKKFKSESDDDAALGEALALLGEVDVSLEIARTALKSRNYGSRVSGATIIECNPSLKVIPLIMENLVLELHRTTTLDPKKADWDVVYVTMCSELIRRTGTNFGNDAAGWCRWWEGVRAKYNAPAPAFDADIVARWMNAYRKMGPSKIRE